MIYLDNAATTFPKPKNVITAINNCLKEYSANPGRSGHYLARRAAESVYNCRKKLAEFFGATEENVIFTQSCTASINTVLKGFLKQGDHVICSALEHNAVIRPLNKLKGLGIEYDVARVFPENTESTVKSFEALIKDNTKLIVCTHSSNVCGVILPIKELGQLAKMHKIKFAVDAAQTAGVIDINVTEMNIDYLCIAPHKGLYAPMGIGVLITADDSLDTLIEGGTGSLSKLPYQPDYIPDKFESGTLNLPGIVGISAGIDFVNSIGLNKIYKTEIDHVSHIFSSLCNNSQIKLYTNSIRMGYYSPVISFNIRNKSSDTVGEELGRYGIAVRTGLHCAPLAHQFLGTSNTGTVRVCPSVFTKRGEIDNLINRIKILSKT